MANIYVIDTSALISNPAVVQIPRRHWVIIPAVVLRQLDGLKNSSDSNTAYWARKASQAIEQQQAKGNLLIESSSLDVNALDNKADNEIIGTALWARRNYVAKNVILVSTDRNMRIAAVNCGLGAEEGNGRKIKLWRTILLSSYILAGMSFWICFFFDKSLNLSEDICVALAISIPVFLVTSIVAAIKYNASCGGGRTPENKDDDDMLMDPAFSSLPCNIHHRR